MNRFILILLLLAASSEVFAQQYNVPFRRRAAAGGGGFVVGHSAFTAATSGTQDITIATWGDAGSHTPTAALIFATWADTDDTYEAHSGWSMGCATSTSERGVVSGSSEDAQADTDTNWWATRDEVVLIIDPVNEDLEGEADFASFSANTVSITWATAPTQVVKLYVVAFAGTDAALCSEFDPNDSAAGTVDVTDLGSEANIVFTFAAAGGFADAIALHAGSAMGIYSYDGSTTTQAGIGWRDRNARTAGQLGIRVEKDSLAVPDDATWGLGSDAVVLSNIATGFRVTSGFYNLNAAVRVLYLALDVPDANDHFVQRSVKQASSGSESFTDPGFQPVSMCVIASTTTNPKDEGGLDPDGWGYGCAVTASSERSLGVSGDDGAATTATDSFLDTDDVASASTSSTPARRIEGDVTSFDATGFTMNWAAATAIYFIALTIK